jgi:glycosyltransferase involved in cell wall biosynthesis
MSTAQTAPKLSLVMPVYNEGSTLQTILEALGKVAMPVPWELIIVDDGSSDGATDSIDRAWIPDAERVVVLKARQNRGKGSALRRGFA